MAIVNCPKGHASEATDFCDQCGLRITGATPAPAGAGTPTAEAVCPDCGTPRTPGSHFCEVCRHDFTAGSAASSPASAHVLAPPPVPAPAAILAQTFMPSPAPPAPAAPSPAAPSPNAPPAMKNPWAVVRYDRSLIDDGDETGFPKDDLERSYPLDLDETMIGRRNGKTHNDIPLADPASSGRHLVISRRPDGGLYATDLHSSNGTRLRGDVLQPGVPTRVADGDELIVGAFTRIAIQAR